MTHRERYVACMTFQPFDRPVLREWSPWGSTIVRWKQEGMEGDYPPELAQCDPEWGIPVNFGPLPAQERVVIGEDEATVTFIDDRGITRRDFKSGSTTSMPDFVDYPIKSRRDWEEDLAWRYDPDTPGRFPDNWSELVKQWKGRKVPLVISAYPHLGMFGPLRDLIGIEYMAPMFYDDPGLIRDIATHWGDFHYRILERLLCDVVPDAVHFWEDMAFHTAPLISPRMFLAFFGPHYRRINDLLIEAGVPVRGVDSDGDSRLLIEPFLECGLNCLWPLEVAAHMDAGALRARHGKRLLLQGGIDKRALALGREAIDRELEARLPLCREGGYIATCDHLLPHDISYDNFRYYWRRKKEMLGVE